MEDASQESRQPTLAAGRSADGAVVLTFAGPWRSGEPLPPLDAFEKEISAPPPPRKAAFDTSSLSSWD